MKMKTILSVLYIFCILLLSSCDKLEDMWNAIIPQKEAASEISVEPIAAELIPKPIALQGSFPYFSGEVPESSGILSASSAVHTFPSAEFSVNPYVFSLNGWTYESEYSFVLGPAEYDDALVFFDASPAMLVLDRQTGAVISYADSPVFPSGSYIFDNTQNRFLFEGRNKKMYAFDFVFDVIPETPLQSQDKKPHEYAGMYLQPSSAAWKEMQFQIGHKITDVDAEFFALAAGAKPLSEKKSISVFAYYPPESAEYTVGVCDENGIFIKARYYTGIFNQAGDLLLTSVDYVADKPQITLPLTKDVIYFIAIGALSEEEPTTPLYAVAKKGSL